MRKPIIAITPKTGNGGDEDSKFCYVFPNFINCVSACGGIPIQLSSLEGSFQVRTWMSCWSGWTACCSAAGPDIHPGTVWGRSCWTAAALWRRSATRWKSR